MKLYKIETGNFKVDGGAMFGVVPKTLWQKKYSADENNLCNCSMRCLLIVDGEKKILIDNGCGDKQDEKYFSHYYLNGDDTLEKSLRKNGFTCDDITDVILTHLHFDHCGGGIKYNSKNEFELTFKNATYHTSKQQWDWAINPNKREAPAYPIENLMPMFEMGKLNFIDENTNLFTNIKIRLYNGHTMGQVIPFINYNGKTIVYVGDLIPVVANIPLPYISSYDLFPLDTLKEKENFLTEAEKNNYTLFFEHDLYNECCSLKNTKKGIIEDKTFTLAEFLQTN
ncbi:MAG: MBL fold metallo-hydrolase [Bacteroidetes bacterium]|nr:MBL fold metallo-hydrolase [Bacteroidota bacterium]